MASIISAGTTSGTSLNLSGDTSGVLQLASNGSTTAVTIDTNQRAAFVAGTAALPAITTTGDTNTGIFFPAADTIAFAEGGTEVARFDSAGNLGIGANPQTGVKLDVFSTSANEVISRSSDTTSYANFIVDVNNVTTQRMQMVSFGSTASGSLLGITRANNSFLAKSGGLLAVGTRDSNALVFGTNELERMRITSGGGVFMGKTTAGIANTGFEYDQPNGAVLLTRSSANPMAINRLINDGTLIEFYQDGSQEGNISVSGTTVSYNGGHLSRWSQLPDGSKDETILKGTVLSNLDDMCVWTKDGTVLDNEQLNKMKVSDVEGDTNVAGVFVNWTFDEECQSDDMNVAMTGDMIIRIADGVVVQKGDLLMSAGDGTAKPQGDDIVRSKTIAKVTSNHVTCTYADGSYCVPCVLMAC